jgi:5-methylcytosine-specific restriction endonuclease McrA
LWNTIMKTKKTNAEFIWKQMEDFVVPRLRLSVLERSIYSHLLRHSRLEGKLRLRFSILWLARAIRLSGGPTREAVRRLVALGVLRLVERSKAGHLVEVRLPEEIRACLLRQPGPKSRACSNPARSRNTVSLPLHVKTSWQPINLEHTDFLQTSTLRRSIHSRERGLCFYCLRRLTPSRKCLDHVVPRVQLGRNSYRNLVSCCVECNSHKGERSAGDFLRWLYRERRLTAVELSDRVRAVDALASGKLLPLLPHEPFNGKPIACLPPQARQPRKAYTPGGPANPFPRKGRPPGSNPELRFR